MDRDQSCGYVFYSAQHSSQQQRIIGPKMSSVRNAWCVVTGMSPPRASRPSSASRWAHRSSYLFRVPQLKGSHLSLQFPAGLCSALWLPSVLIGRVPALSLVKYLEYFINICKIWPFLSISLPKSSYLLISDDADRNSFL